MDCSNYSNVYSYDYHTPAEWRYNYEQEIIAAEAQQELAQRLTLEAARHVNQAKDLTVKNELEINHQSKVKVKDVEFKCNEIERQKFDLDEEIGLLLGYQKRIENANKSLVGDSLDVIAECLKLRNCRVSIDLVFDDVEKELLRERELILGIKDQLEDLLDKVVLQIRKLRAFTYKLAEDLQCKRNTLAIESHNEKLDKNSVERSVLNLRNVFKPATVSTAEWNGFTWDILSTANKVLVEGRPIRAFFDKCLNKMFEDLVAQSNTVDQAIRLRVEEYQEVIEELNKQKVETAKKVGEVWETINGLEAAIDEKEASMALVHARLSNRSRRDGVELCRDEMEAKLFVEAFELENGMRALQQIKAESVACLRRLKQTAVRIDEQLEVKLNSLRIDNESCVEQRKRVDYRSY